MRQQDPNYYYADHPPDQEQQGVDMMDYGDHHNNGMMQGSDYAYYAETQPSCMSWQTFLSIVLFLFCVFFSILVIYSLVVFNGDAVTNLCPQLYPYVLTRTVLGYCVSLSGFVYNCFCSTGERSSPTVIFFFLIYFLALAIYGGVVVSKNMIGNQACTDTIQDKTFQAPLLGDLGWVYVICDAFYAVCTCLLLYQNLATTPYMMNLGNSGTMNNRQNY